MWQWITRIYEEYHALFGVFDFCWNLVGLFILLWGGWTAHRKLAGGLRRVKDALWSIVGHEYRRAYARRKIKRLDKSIHELEDFGERQREESFSRFLEYICTAAALFLWVVGGAWLLGLWIVGTMGIILEAEILKHPVPPFHVTTREQVRIYLLFVFAACFIGVLLLAAEHAQRLSPSAREKRIKSLNESKA